ncbi:hypothetical protein ACFFS2_34440 [Streptomyces aurantiacus]|uniref:Uncharacterized protein n=1 Tax=Streptomyces aurantiacus TaxID=47760 RepID=A0A7G1PD08_9ACTN|nr:hypothetical protein [Streptomyces aurantiacus]BCL32932.1 hypothetical protein GCM10017557_77910 [Streptomyces aurantiacus]
MDTQTWDALVASMKNAYTADLAQGTAPRPVIMPLVRGELVGLIWLRPTKDGEDALTAIVELSNVAAAASADEVVLAWETQDVATACRLPATGPVPCLNLVHATKEGHVLHQLPYTHQPLGSSSGDPVTAGPLWLPAPGPQPGGELSPPIQAALRYSFTPLDLDHPSPFGVTVLLMEDDGYTVHLTDTFTP